MTVDDTMENIVLAFEAVGVAIIVLGGLVALFAGVKDYRSLPDSGLPAPAKRIYGVNTLEEPTPDFNKE